MVGVYWYVATCTYGPSKLLHQHQSVQCPFEMERSSSRGMHACSMALARGPLPSSSAPCDSTVPEWPPCVLSHVPACPPDHHHACASRDRPMQHGWISTRRCRFLFLFHPSHIRKGRNGTELEASGWLPGCGLVTLRNPHMSRRQKSARHAVLDR